MKAHYQLVKHAINDMGFAVSVWDGEEWQVKRSTSVAAVMDAIESVDESALRFRDKDGERQGWADIVLGNDGGDEVSDYSMNVWLDAWFQRVIMGAA